MYTLNDKIEDHFVKVFGWIVKNTRYDTVMCSNEPYRGDYIDHDCLTKDNEDGYYFVKIWYTPEKDVLTVETKRICNSPTTRELVHMPRSHPSFNFYYEVFNSYIRSYKLEKEARLLSSKADRMLESKGCSED